MSTNILRQNEKNNLGQRASLEKGRRRESDIDGYIDYQERDVDSIDSHFDSICRMIGKMLLHPVGADVDFEKQKGNYLQRVKIKIKYYVSPE